MIIDKFVKNLGFKNKNELQDFVNTFMKHKDEFIEFLNMKKNNIAQTVHCNCCNCKDLNNNIPPTIPFDINKDQDYINLKKINDDNNLKILELESKITSLTSNVDDNTLFTQLKEKNKKENVNINIDDKIKNAVDEALQKQSEKFNIKINNINRTHTEEINKIKSEYEKAKTSLPSPSSSTENKKDKINKEKVKNINGKIIPLSDNLLEIVYYRNFKDDKFKPTYYKNNNKFYLKCCSVKYNKEIKYNKQVTCTRCYNTYKISEKEVNGIHEMFTTILPEHEISNEEEILKKIKCDNCNYICKKEIKTCYDCNRIKKSKINVFNLPNKNDRGYEAKLLLAKETYNELSYVYNIYEKAIDDGVDITELTELINYIKENKVLEEKQPNIIKNKISRCHSIIKLYNKEEYKDIQEYIQMINFDIKAISKLTYDQWNIFWSKLKEILNKKLEDNGFRFCKYINKIGKLSCDKILNSDENKRCKYHSQFCEICYENINGSCICNKKCKHCNLLLKECKC
jgi:hypothetical protein